MNLKRILITGADGFIGSHLTEHIYSLTQDKNSPFYAAKIRALSLYNSFNFWGHLEDVSCKNELDIRSGDIRDPHFCQHLCEGVNLVFHLASLIAIPYSYKSPQSYIDTNVKGTLNIVSSALRHNVNRVVHVSTSEVYGTAKYVPIDELHPLQPQSPYSASKIAADAIALSFYHSFNLPLVVARPFNTYGPRQSARAVIPSIIIQIASGLKEIKVGDLTPTRDFNYVLDTCQGLIDIALSDVIGECINIGSGLETSILDTFKMIKSLMGSSVNFIVEEERIRPTNSEVRRLLCDNTKLKSISNFSPKFSLEDGLKKTIEWFTDKHNLNKYKSNIYNY